MLDDILDEFVKIDRKNYRAASTQKHQMRMN